VTLLPAALALALAATGPAASPSPSPEVREQVEDLLGTIHGPLAPEAFRAVGPGAEEALAEIARSRAMPSRRIRALEALAGLGGPQAEAAHRDVAASAAPTPVRRAAIRGLGRLAGPGGATRALAPYLEGDRDPTVRAAAAEAIAEEAPAAGCGRIRARARAEGDTRRFRRALDACARGAAAR
jgi:HEAT repeat protein